MAFSIHFPHSSNGQVDWFTLGNILTGELLGQVYCASYLDSKYGRANEGFVPDTTWEYIGEERDVVLMKRRLEGTRLDSFMGRGIIDFPVPRIAEAIQDMHKIQNWERYLVGYIKNAFPNKVLIQMRFHLHLLIEEARLLRSLSERNEDSIVYRRYEATTCLLKKQADFVFYVRSQFHDEKFVRASVSVEDPSYPEYNGVIRAKILPGTGFLLEPYNGDTNRTLVTYMAGLSLGGLPTIVTNRVVKALPLSIYYLNEYLKKISILSPNSLNVTVDRHVETTEEDHSICGPLKSHIEAEKHLSATSQNSGCQNGDTPTMIVMTTTLNEERLIHETAPQLELAVKTECDLGTDTSSA